MTMALKQKEVFSGKKQVFVALLAMVLTILFVLPQTTHAQFSRDTIELQSAPSSPKANERVTAQLTSSTVDLKRSDIVWYLNNIRVESGKGVVTYSFSVGNAGVNTVLEAFITDPNGAEFSKTLTYSTQDMDLVWAGHTYTPPFYKGLSLSSPQSFVKVHALPTIIVGGRQLAPSEIDYTWRVDGIVLGSKSGVGKDTVALRAHNLNRGTIKVQATAASLDGVESVSKTIEIENINPEIGLYRIHPLEGIQYNNAIGRQYIQTSAEESVTIVPWYFSLDDIEADKIEYRWEVNNSRIAPNTNNPRIMTFRKAADSEGGSVRVDIEVENISKLLQYIKRSLTLTI